MAYAHAQGKIGGPISLDELSALLDEGNPRTFAEFILAGDYGISESLAVDKRSLNQYRRYIGRAEGMSISLGAPARQARRVRPGKRQPDHQNLPTRLIDPLKRSAA